jgi:hypothetical protein
LLQLTNGMKETHGTVSGVNDTLVQISKSNLL